MVSPLPEFLHKEFDDDSLVYQDGELYYNKGVDKSIIQAINNKSIQIYDGWYEWNEGWKSPKIYLLAYSPDYGKLRLKIENFLPYCYVKDASGKYRSFLGEPLEKIEFRAHPRTVALYRDKLASRGLPIPYESDIPYVKRFRITIGDYFKSDKEIYPPIAILDIETNHPVGDDIISIAINYDGELCWICLLYTSPSPRD